MKKFIYLLTILLVGCLAFSCTNNNDQPVVLPPVTPPAPPEDFDEDKLVGTTWEIYYYTKQFIARPGESTEKRSLAMRVVDFDGARTAFSKDSDGNYIFINTNADNEEVVRGIYRVVDDTVKHYFKSTFTGIDTITNRHVYEFGTTKGIMKYDDVYTGTVENGTKYILTDRWMLRNVEEAPNSLKDVPGGKIMVDFDDLADGKWVFTTFTCMLDGVLDKHETEKIKGKMEGTVFNFYKDADNDMRCHLQAWDEGKKYFGGEDFPVVVVDDVVFFMYTNDKGQPDSFAMWVTRREGSNRIIDSRKQRYDQNVEMLVEEDIYYDRTRE